MLIEELLNYCIFLVIFLASYNHFVAAEFPNCKAVSWHEVLTKDYFCSPN